MISLSLSRSLSLSLSTPASQLGSLSTSTKAGRRQMCEGFRGSMSSHALWRESADRDARRYHGGKEGRGTKTTHQPPEQEQRRRQQRQGTRKATPARTRARTFTRAAPEGADKNVHTSGEGAAAERPNKAEKGPQGNLRTNVRTAPAANAKPKTRAARRARTKPSLRP